MNSNTTEKNAKSARPIPGTDNDRKGQYAITIHESPEELYAFWRDFKNLTLFMKDISDIEILSDKRSKWTVKLKSGLTVDWIAEITEDVPGKKLSWESVEGKIGTSGSIWFSKAPLDRGTIVSLALDYKIPGGKFAEMATLFTGEDPDDLIQTNLKRLKGFLETGVIATVEGQTSGREEINLH